MPGIYLQDNSGELPGATHSFVKSQVYGYLKTNNTRYSYIGDLSGQQALLGHINGQLSLCCLSEHNYESQEIL